MRLRVTEQILATERVEGQRHGVFMVARSIRSVLRHVSVQSYMVIITTPLRSQRYYIPMVETILIILNVFHSGLSNLESNNTG